MVTRIVTSAVGQRQGRAELQAAALEFILTRRALAGAGPDEFLAGYVEGFRGVFCQAKKLAGETWFCWFVDPAGGGRCARLVNRLASGLYSDAQTGDVFEWPGRWVLVVGSVVRIGPALLTREMLQGDVK